MSAGRSADLRGDTGMGAAVAGRSRRRAGCGPRWLGRRSRCAHAARLLARLVRGRSRRTHARGRKPSVFDRSQARGEDGQDRPLAAGAALAAQRNGDAVAAQWSEA